MNFFKHTIFIGLIVLVSGCNNSKKVSESKSSESNLENSHSFINYNIVYEGVLYGAGQEGLEQGVKEARNEQDYNSIIRKMQLKDDKISDYSEHIFEDTMFVFLFDKVRNTGGYKLEVVDVQKSDDQIIFNVSSKAPDDNAPSVIAQPYLIIVIEKTSLPINYNSIE